MKAHLRFYQKSLIRERFVLEVSIHDVGLSLKYPERIKYGMICKDLKTNRYVLMDNHHPKGPHVHVNDDEFVYNFVNEYRLMEDFKRLVKKELGVQL